MAASRRYRSRMIAGAAGRDRGAQEARRLGRGGAGQASHRETGSRVGDLEVAQRAGGRSGPGAAGVDSDHDQRQDPTFGLRRAVPAGRVQPVGRHRMTAAFDEAALRHWLVDYLVTNIGCSPDEIDFDAPLNDLGVGSRDAVVLSGELSELLGRPVSPVEFWQHPTINCAGAVSDRGRGRTRIRGGGGPRSGIDGRADRGDRSGVSLAG